MKMRNMTLKQFAVISMVGFSCVLFAQNNELNNSMIGSDSVKISTKKTIEDTQLYLIVKNNNVEYVCQILSDDGREVLIYTEKLGKIYIPKSEILSIEKIQNSNSLVRGEYYDAGAFTTRYSFTTNALPMKQGANYAMMNLYGPEAHFALSNRFSVGVMSTWIASPFVVALKYSFPTKNEKLNFSLGTLIGTSSYFNSFRGFGGLHFGNVTFGDAKKNLTLSAGYAYVSTGGDGNDNNYNGATSIGYQTPRLNGPVFSIAGITKVGVKASFIFDSMIGVFDYNESNVAYNYNSISSMSTAVYTYTPGRSLAMLLMPGMRFQKSENKAFQISLAGLSVTRLLGINGEKSVTIPLPMCTWFYKF